MIQCLYSTFLFQTWTAPLAFLICLRFFFSSVFEWQFKLKEMEDALSQLQSVERELSRLAAQPWPEPKEMLGGLLVYNPSKYAVKWQFKSPQQLAEEDPKHLYLLKKRSSNPALHENAGRSNPVKTGSPVKERKESRKNCGLLFQKIFDAIQTIVSKAWVSSFFLAVSCCKFAPRLSRLLVVL